MTQTIWYDADTLLEEVLDTMPDDIKFLFDNPPVVTENDMSDYFAPAGAVLPEEFDIDVDEELQDFFDNACCPNASYAARALCGCRGSGDPTNLSKAAQQALEDRQMP